AAGLFEVATPGGSVGHLAADCLASLPGLGTPVSADGRRGCPGQRTTHDGRDLTASLSSVRLHRHIGEGGSCDPCYPLDQPPTSDPQPVVLADTGTDARENIGSSPHRINCLAPLLTGLSKGVRDMREPLRPSRSARTENGWPRGATIKL